MSTLRRERIVGKTENELDEFTCGVCHDIFRQPMVTNCCQQTYCRTCIEEWLRRCNTCPNCRQGLTMADMTPAPRLVANLLNEMTVQCEYYANGCPEVRPFCQLLSHLKSCQHKVCKICDFRGSDEHNCIERLLKKNQHLKDENVQAKRDIDKLKKKNDEFVKLMNRENDNRKKEIENLKRINEVLESKQGQSISMPSKPDISGLYKLHSDENFDELLKEIGINRFWRHLYRISIGNIEIIRNGTNCYIVSTFSNANRFLAHNIQFIRQKLVFGETNRQMQFNGKMTKTSMKFERGKIIEETEINNKIVKTSYEAKGNDLFIVTSTGNVVSTRFYKRVVAVEQKYFTPFETMIYYLFAIIMIIMCFLPILEIEFPSWWPGIRINLSNIDRRG